MGRPKLDRTKFMSYDAKTNRSTCLVCNKKFKGKVLNNIKRHYRLMHKLNLEENVESIELSVRKMNIEMSPNEFMKCCVGLVTVSGMPFELFDDNDYFKKLLKPYENACNITISSSYIITELDSYAEQMRNRLFQLLIDKMVCIKLDIISKLDKRIVAINAQLIDNFEIQIFTLGMIELKQEHTSIFLKDEIFNCINKFGVHDMQIYYLTIDNGANCVSTTELLQEHNNTAPNEYEEIHERLSSAMLVVRCPVHMLQSAVQDVFKTVAKELKKCRDATCALRKVINNGAFAADIQMPTLDNAASWNSTFDMLKSLQKLNAFVNEHGVCCDLNWVFIQNFIDAFKSVVEYTTSLQSKNYVIGDFYRDWLLCETRLENIHCNAIADTLLQAMKVRKLQLSENDAFIAALYMDRRFNFMDTPFLSEAQRKRAITHIIQTSEILSTIEKNNMDTEESHADDESMQETDDGYDLLERKVSSLTQQPYVLRSAEIENVAHESKELPLKEPVVVKIEKNDLTSADIEIVPFEHESIEASNDKFDLLERKVNSLTQQSEVLQNVQSIRQKLESLAFESRLPFRTDVIKYWQELQTTEPALVKLSEVVLSVPCSQASVERVYSALSVPIENHSNLNLDNIDNLLFIRLNENLFKDTNLS